MPSFFEIRFILHYCEHACGPANVSGTFYRLHLHPQNRCGELYLWNWYGLQSCDLRRRKQYPNFITAIFSTQPTIHCGTSTQFQSNWERADLSFLPCKCLKQETLGQSAFNSPIPVRNSSHGKVYSESVGPSKKVLFFGGLQSNNLCLVEQLMAFTWFDVRFEFSGLENDISVGSGKWGWGRE